MPSILVIVGVVLIVAWVIWWWLVRGHQEQTAALDQHIAELEQRNESK